MPIPALPLFKHRDTVVTPADQNQFVTQFETTMDTMSNDVIPALNLAITDINAKVITATTARDESEDARDISVAAKDEALTAVATLQEGAIDDTTIAPNKAFSNQYIENNYYDKTETYNKTEVDTAISDATFDINTLTDKPTPSDTDNFALQEVGGLLKKLSFANLMAWIKSFSFGWGQTWQDVTASRSAGVTYTNSTGRPIYVNITNNTGMQVKIGGLLIASIQEQSGARSSISFIVPKDTTYLITASSVYKWAELR